MELNIYVWFIIVYIVGTLLGYRFAWYRASRSVASSTIDMLAENGYLKMNKNDEFVKVK